MSQIQTLALRILVSTRLKCADGREYKVVVTHIGQHHTTIVRSEYIDVIYVPDARRTLLALVKFIDGIKFPIINCSI